MNDAMAIQALFDTVPLFARKALRSLYGDFKGQFVLLARVSVGDYITAYQETKAVTSHVARAWDEAQVRELYFQKALSNAPLPLLYPADVVVIYSRNTAVFCRPVPATMTINAWVEGLHQIHQALAPKADIPSHLMATLTAGLYMARAPYLAREIQLAAVSRREFYMKTCDKLDFLLSQKRDLPVFGF